MANNFPNGLMDALSWSEELGMGFHSRPAMSYDGGYFEKYQVLDNSDMGASLTRLRVDMVERHHGDDSNQVIDIGIGGGRFVTQYGGFGYDVNPDAIEWLTDRGWFRDPYVNGAEVLTFWDSLEHIPNPEAIVARASRWVFVSMPIYSDLGDCLGSPHYKPGEHIWYWTFDGLARWFQRQGFEMYEANHMETEAGRRGIMSFAFKRIRQE